MNASREAGLPEPEIQEKDGGIQVTLFQKSNQVGNQAAGGDKKTVLEILADILKGERITLTDKHVERYASEAAGLNESQIRVMEFCQIPRKRKEILEEGLGISNQTKNFRANISPLLEADILQLTIKDRPQSPLQKYLLTNKGNILLAIFKNNKK